MDGQGQNLTLQKIQIDEPFDYLIDWYCLGDNEREYLLLDDELQSKRGCARNRPLLYSSKNTGIGPEVRARIRVKESLYFMKRPI